MGIYILRHEEINIQNPLFDSSLTKNGLNNANKLIEYIETLNIDTIYSSSFLRAIQTIYPYSSKYNKLINIENSLYESLDSTLFNRYNSNFTWCDLPSKYHYIINKKYKSIYGKVKLYEKFGDVCDRVKPFIEEIKSLPELEKYKLSEELRANVISKHSWDKTSAEFERIFDSIDCNQNRWEHLNNQIGRAHV